MLAEALVKERRGPLTFLADLLVFRKYIVSNYKVEKIKKEYALLLLLLFIVSANMAGLSQSFPVIGVITLTYRRTNLSYVNEMYVKFVEMYGGQVVPVYAFSSAQALRELLTKINGVIFPGGSMNIYVKRKWRENVEVIFNYAIEQNDKGNTFPILGTCLGLQLMAFIVGKNDNIMTLLLGGDHDQIHPLIFTDDFYQYYTHEHSHLKNMRQLKAKKKPSSKSLPGLRLSKMKHLGTFNSRQKLDSTVIYLFDEKIVGLKNQDETFDWLYQFKLRIQF